KCVYIVFYSITGNTGMGGNGKFAPPLAVHSEYLSYLAHANRGIGHFGGIIYPSKIGLLQ
ncbi:hypothetical protein, partial [Pedobacter cryotolerans]